jgi:hypothetical protein
MSVTDLKFNKQITDAAIGFLQDTQDFAATQAFQVVGIDDEYGSYLEYTLEDLLKTTLERVGPGSSFPKTEVGSSWKTIELYKHGVDRPIPDEKKKRLRNAKQDAADQLMVEGYRYLEKLMIDTIMGTAKFDTTKTGGVDFTVFSDSSSDPIAVVSEYVDLVAQTTGKKPDSILMGADVFRKLKNHADIVGRIGENIATRKATLATLAELFEVDNIYVSRGVQNTANKGGTANTAYQTSNEMLIYYKGAGNSIETPSAAKIIYCDNPIYGGNLLNILEGRDQDAEADIIRIKGYFMPVVTAKALGLKLTNCF